MIYQEWDSSANNSSICFCMYFICIIMSNLVCVIWRRFPMVTRPWYSCLLPSYFQVINFIDNYFVAFRRWFGDYSQKCKRYKKVYCGVALKGYIPFCALTILRPFLQASWSATYNIGTFSSFLLSKVLLSLLFCSIFHNNMILADVWVCSVALLKMMKLRDRL